jgi:hypothetical protein
MSNFVDYARQFGLGLIIDNLTRPGRRAVFFIIELFLGAALRKLVKTYH